VPKLRVRGPAQRVAKARAQHDRVLSGSREAWLDKNLWIGPCLRGAARRTYRCGLDQYSGTILAVCISERCNRSDVYCNRIRKSPALSFALSVKIT
jgi:hypothetical protein